MAGTVTTTSKANTLIYNYLPMIRECVTTYSPLIMRLKKKAGHQTTPDGKGWVLDIEHTGHKGHGFAAENAALPTPGYRQDVNATYNVKQFYLRTDWTTKLIYELESKKSSFDGTGIQRTLKTATKDAAKEMNRVYWGTGFGYLAMVQSASTNVGTVSTAGTTYYPYGYGACNGTKFIGVNSRLMMVDNAAGTSWTGAAAISTEAAGTITAVTDTTVTMTTDPNITEASGDWYGTYSGFEDSTVAAPVPNEPWGLAAIVSHVDPDDVIGAYSGGTITTGVGTNTYTTLGGLAIASYNWWKSGYVYNEGTSALYTGGATTLSELSMHNAFDFGTKKYGPDGSPTAIYCSWPVFRAYGQQLVADRRYQSAVMTLEGGFTALNFNGIPIIPDRDADDGVMYFVNEPSIIVFEDEDMHWMDMGEGILKYVSGYASYEAVLEHRFQIGTDCRDKHCKLYNIDAF